MPVYTVSNNPKNIPGLRFWLDAADESTVDYFNKTIGDFAARTYGDTSGITIPSQPSIVTYPNLQAALDPINGFVTLEMGVSNPQVLSPLPMPGTVSYNMVTSIRDKISNTLVISTYSFTRGNTTSRTIRPNSLIGTQSLGRTQSIVGTVNLVGDYRTMSRSMPYEYNIPARLYPDSWFGFARKYPRYEVGAVNGKSAIKFNKPFPGEIGMIADNVGLLDSATYTVFCVYAPVNPTSSLQLGAGLTAQGQYVVSIYDSNRISRHGGYPNLGFFYGDGNPYNQSIVVTTQSTTFSRFIRWSKNTRNTANSSIVIAQFRNSATSSNGIPLYKILTESNNYFMYGFTGVGINSGSGSFFDHRRNNSRFVIGYNPTLGTSSSQREIYNSGPKQFTGYFCEFLYYDRALTDLEMSKVNQYLVKKWNGPVKQFPESFMVRDYTVTGMQQTTTNISNTNRTGAYQFEYFWQTTAGAQQGRNATVTPILVNTTQPILSGTPMYCRLEIIPNLATGSAGHTNTWRHWGIWCGNTTGTPFGSSRWNSRKPDLVFRPGLTQGVYESTFCWPQTGNSMKCGWASTLGIPTQDYGWTFSGWINMQFGNLESI